MLRRTDVARWVLSTVIVVSAGSLVFAQHDQHGTAGSAPAPGADPDELPSYVSEPIQRYTVGLGPFTRPISSSNPEAQAFFDQGFQMMYAFAKLDAVRSFREAWTRDPACAICYWGEG